MVSGQSFVLYSRLYLINLDKRIRRYVLAMIIVNGVVLHTATAVTAAGSNSKVSSLFITPYAILERIQITVFCVQEFILSGLYVWKAWKFLAIYRSGGSKTQDKLRAMMLHLILSNVVVVSLDISIIVLEFMGLYYVQVSSPRNSFNLPLQGLRHGRSSDGIVQRTRLSLRSTCWLPSQLIPSSPTGRLQGLCLQRKAKMRSWHPEQAGGLRQAHDRQAAAAFERQLPHDVADRARVGKDAADNVRRHGERVRGR